MDLPKGNRNRIKNNNYLKDVLKKNSFATNLVDKWIKKFLNKQFVQKILENTVPKKNYF